jgi:hypothetical protein
VFDPRSRRVPGATPNQFNCAWSPSIRTTTCARRASIPSEPLCFDPVPLVIPDQNSRKVPLAEAVATSRSVTSTWTKAVDPDAPQTDPCRAVVLPLEVHVMALHGAVQAHRRQASSKDSGIDGEGRAGAAYVPPRTVPDAGAGRRYQLRHWSAGTISASTSDAFSRSTFPPTT